MNTIEKEYGNKLEGLMIEDNIQSLKDVLNVMIIMQELPNLVNTKLSEGERKQFLLVTLVTETIHTPIILKPFQTKII
jgi:hypothetical protein